MKNEAKVSWLNYWLGALLVVAQLLSLSSCGSETESPEAGQEINIRRGNVEDSAANTVAETVFTQEDADYEATMSLGTLVAMEDFLKQYPRGKYSSTIKAEIAQTMAVRDSIESAQNEEEAYRIARRDTSTAAYDYYIQRFPDGKYVVEARRQINVIKEKQRQREQRLRDQRAYQAAVAKGTIEAFQQYLREFPQGEHQEQAKAEVQRIERERQEHILNEDRIYNEAVRLGTIEAYEAYVIKYPNGKFRDDATRILAILREERQFQLNAPPNMVYVRGGQLDMGSASFADENPVRKVTVGSFYMHQFEVTNSQYALFLNAYGSDVVKGGGNAGQDMIFEEEWGLRYNGQNWEPQPSFARYPVINVTWYGANEFCRHYGFRLPTEAEWEYSARGGNKGRLFQYSGSAVADTAAWYSRNSRNTLPVGKKQRNELGLYDMSGNVAEWCSDWYDNNYYRTGTANNPQGPSEGQAKVLRGGSFFDDKDKLRVAKRDFSFPFVGYYTYGFRCVKDI